MYSTGNNSQYLVMTYHEKESAKEGGEKKVKVTCLTLCDPTDCSSPDFSVHGIF